uniref:Uncharacterized protein n=1 Tax=Myotis myotis TaxID=51298 RepID=A0A7J7ZYK0_MYOMY|nr:hypothetical protein mMyoMyo1_009964 [Myotis myotis]
MPATITAITTIMTITTGHFDAHCGQPTGPIRRWGQPANLEAPPLSWPAPDGTLPPRSRASGVVAKCPLPFPGQPCPRSACPTMIGPQPLPPASPLLIAPLYPNRRWCWPANLLQLLPRSQPYPDGPPPP